ncbi:MAG TPA: hypothetical protein ENK05_12525 [Gammaproteobacteria bacterium]|nr:hypothetical protein [Gammaproteobacteria bacterium]
MNGPTDRRAFFRRGVERLGKGLTKEAMRRAEQRASRWIRPPFAAPELEFLVACTRCAACIEACPHDVIFPLPARCGATVVGTPALDLNHRGCHLCPDWPCVAACEPAALCRPPEEPEALPRLASVSLESRYCLPYQGPECGACAGSCPLPDTLRWEGTRPSIDAASCVGCALCREACIADPRAFSVAALRDQPAPAED